MSKYYIKITDELPSDEDPSLWFEFNSLNNEILVLNKSEYTTLKGRVDDAIDSFRVDPDVIQAVRDIITDESFQLTNSINTSNVVEDGNTGNAYNYESLKRNFDNINEKLDNKTDYNFVESNISNLSNKNSQQDTRLSSLENSLNWNKTFMRWGLNGVIYENRVYYNDFLVCFFLDNLPPHQGDGSWGMLIDFNTNYNPTHLFPPNIVIVDTMSESFRLTNEGKLYYKVAKGQSGFTNPYSFFLYPRKTMLDIQ